MIVGLGIDIVEIVWFGKGDGVNECLVKWVFMFVEW